MKRPLSYINDIRTVPIPHRITQQDGLGWIMKALQKGEGQGGERRVNFALNLYERMMGQSGIQYRRSILKDYTHADWDSMELYRPSQTRDGQDTPWYAPPLEDRMAIFARSSDAMMMEAFSGDEAAPETLIEVSCTGYEAPYPAQKLLLQKGWQGRTQLLKLGHMGCYASMPGLNLAARLSGLAPDRNVDFMSYELCTLHLQPQATSAEQVVANTIFADGAARVSLSSKPGRSSLAILAYEESLIPGTADSMDWKLANSSFSMKLSREIPQILERSVGTYIKDFLEQNGSSLQRVDRVAVHPGGPRIIETVQKALDLDERHVSHSKAVLAAYGNMSSATLPHIWKAMLHDTDVADGERILSIAFGPGLTVVMNLLAKNI